MKNKSVKAKERCIDVKSDDWRRQMLKHDTKDNDEGPSKSCLWESFIALWCRYIWHLIGYDVHKMLTGTLLEWR